MRRKTEDSIYPICSIVAMFKMLVRILNIAPKPHLGYIESSVFLSLAGEGIRSEGFYREWGYYVVRGNKLKRIQDYYLLELFLKQEIKPENFYLNPTCPQRQKMRILDMVICDVRASISYISLRDIAYAPRLSSQIAISNIRIFVSSHLTGW